MKKQRRGLNRYNLLQDGKKGKKSFYTYALYIKKLNVKKKLKKKRQQQKTVLTGFEPSSTKIDGSWFIYVLKRAFYILRYRVTKVLHAKIVVNYQATALRNSGLYRLFFVFYVVFRF